MNKDNFIIKLNENQALETYWQREIEKNLPPNINRLCKETKVMQRKRNIKEPVKLLMALMNYALSDMSIRLLSVCGHAIGAGSMTEKAWRVKLHKAAAWLQEILNYLLGQITEPQNTKLKIKIVDTTTVRQQGSDQKKYRIHTCYDMMAARIQEIIVSTVHTAEGFELFNITKGFLYLADAGYGRARNIASAIIKQADIIVRFSPSQMAIYEKYSHEKIDMAQMLKTKKSLIDMDCCIKYNNQYFNVRVVGSKLPEDKIEASIKRKKRRAQKNQQKIKEETLIYAEWVLLVTTLDISYGKNEVLDIYRSRWQIELLFKRMKQHLRAHFIKPGSEKYALTLVYLWLILWALVEKNTIKLMLLIAQKNLCSQSISYYQITSFCFLRLHSIIRSLWPLQLPLDDLACFFSRTFYVHPYRAYQFNSFSLPFRCFT